MSSEKSKSQRKKITDRDAVALKPSSSGRTELMDTAVPGLRLRANRDGTKTWFVLSKLPGVGGEEGRKVRVNLGRYPTVGVADARREAGHMKERIRLGENPNQAKREALEAAQNKALAAENAITLRKALDLYDSAKLSKQRTGADTKRELNSNFSKLMEITAAAITTAQIAGVIDTKAKKAPVMARRLHAYGRAWFKWLAARQYVPSNPFEVIQAPGSEKARERVLSSSEVAALWNSAPDIGAPFSHCFRVMMITGQRREEVAGMRRDELDLKAKAWTVPAGRSKTGRALKVPLPDAAVMEIKAAIKVAKGKKFVFSTTGDTSISGFSKAKKRWEEAAQAIVDEQAAKEGGKGEPIPNWRLHDFRRTMVSAMADMGVDPTVADRCLNHKAAATMSTVQRVYQQSDMFDQRKHATNAWAAKVLEWAGAESNGNVVSLPERRERA